jgi:16S rRNA (adenine1518-N6/adenine1519-N6)-dimethyltransferase
MSGRAKKRFGQNFLQDRYYIEAILQHVRPSSDESLIEIGPGRGALSEPLGRLREDLIVVELDRDLIAGLKDVLPNTATVYQGDALNFDFDQFSGPLFIVGNLPYNISTPLLFKLFELGSKVSSMVFMLQKEVVDRLAAPSNTKQFGRLSVMAQYHCEIEKLIDVPPTAFHPRPKIDSAVVLLKPRQSHSVKAEALPVLSELLIAAFGQRRKTLRNALSSLLDAQTLEALEINPSARAETLSVNDFVTCANFIHRSRS